MNKKEIGEYLKSRRKVSKAELSRVTGLTRTQITSIEGGISNYTIDSLLTYCEACEYRVMFLAAKK